MASKSRKKVFPKKPIPLNSQNALLLGKNSHHFESEYKKALYTQPSRVKIKTPLTEIELRSIARLQKLITKA